MGEEELASGQACDRYGCERSDVEVKLFGNLAESLIW